MRLHLIFLFGILSCCLSKKDKRQVAYYGEPHVIYDYPYASLPVLSPLPPAPLIMRQPKERKIVYGKPFTVHEKNLIAFLQPYVSIKGPPGTILTEETLGPEFSSGYPKLTPPPLIAMKSGKPVAVLLPVKNQDGTEAVAPFPLPQAELTPPPRRPNIKPAAVPSYTRTSRPNLLSSKLIFDAESSSSDKRPALINNSSVPLQFPPVYDPFLFSVSKPNSEIANIRFSPSQQIARPASEGVSQFTKLGSNFTVPSGQPASRPSSAPTNTFFSKSPTAPQIVKTSNFTRPMENRPMARPMENRTISEGQSVFMPNQFEMPEISPVRPDPFDFRIQEEIVDLPSPGKFSESQPGLIPPSGLTVVGHMPRPIFNIPSLLPFSRPSAIPGFLPPTSEGAAEF